MRSENSENINTENHEDELNTIEPCNQKKESDMLIKEKLKTVNLLLQEEQKPENILAIKKAKNWIKLSNNFLSLKKDLKSYKNVLLEFIFERIGYRYKGHIPHPNFLHLSAEAWLLGIFQEIEKEINENIQSITFNRIINLISQIIVKENVFIENMEILIGKFKYLEPFAKEDKIFRSILIDMNSTKNEILKDERILKNDELSYEKFMHVIEKILRTSFNNFLNNINSAEENKKSTLLCNNFEHLNKTKNLSFEEFQKSYITAKNMKDITSDNLRHQLVGYFEFCLSNFEDLITELDIFNNNSKSIVFKILHLLPKITLIETINDKLNHLKKFNFDFFSMKNLRLENVRKFIENCYCYALTEVNHYGDNNLKNMKNWINSIDIVKSAKDITYKYYSKGKNAYSNYVNFTFDKANFLNSPLKNLTLLIKEKGSYYTMTVLHKTRGSAIALQRFVLDFLTKYFQILKDFIPGKEHFFKIDSNSEYFYTIEVSKSLLLKKPRIFFDFFNSLKEKLSKIYNMKLFIDAIPTFENKKKLEAGIDKNELKQSNDFISKRKESQKDN